MYDVGNGLHYRPTWIARMGAFLGIYPFAEPLQVDRQDYTNSFFQCPNTRDWTDERNHCYGYNYLFLGNSRLTGDKYRYFPVRRSRITTFSNTVMAADSMGTAASTPKSARHAYTNDGDDAAAIGNEGFGLDAPRLTPTSDRQTDVRGGPDDRHSKRVNVVFTDTHAASMTPEAMGYGRMNDDVYIDLQAPTKDLTNKLFSGTNRDDDPPAIPN